MTERHPQPGPARHHAGRRASAFCLALAAGLLVAGCSGGLSTLEPAGRDAERLTTLFWWMAGGAVVVWLVVIGLTLYALRVEPHAHDRRAAVFIIGGGTVFPTVVLAALLSYGLSIMPEVMAQPPEGGLEIAVSGEQWWWRVRYLPPGGEPVELANEIRLPVGERVRVSLDSPDVIHSFWVPALTGKMDMIPGRTNHLALEPTRTGVFHGACAEYCGTSHALMQLRVVVTERAEFDRWLAQQARPAAPPADALAARGRELFLADGCGACHAVRGTPADGAVGPDLTHVGSRLTLAAGVLPNEPAAFERWLANTNLVKPDAHMPAFGMLPAEDLAALAAYLESLQ